MVDVLVYAVICLALIFVATGLVCGTLCLLTISVWVWRVLREEWRR